MLTQLYSILYYIAVWLPEQQYILIENIERDTYLQARSSFVIDRDKFSTIRLSVTPNQTPPTPTYVVNGP
jgi:hypothetical protein